MAQTRDLYEVLGVRRDASQDEIRKAYRRLARAYHPDVSDDPEAEHKIKELNLAYQTLSDPAKRRQYDMFGGEGLSPDMFVNLGDISDIFEAFFGSPFGRRSRRSRRPARGADAHAVVALTFEEAAFGTRTDVEIEVMEGCEECGGSGAAPGTSPTRCGHCGGTGEVSDVRRSVFGSVMTSRICGTCGGTGQEIRSPCPACGGEGRVARNRTIPVDVPRGVADGVELRIEGAGHRGHRGAPPGDLYLTLRVAPHPLFERRGQDLVSVVEIPATQAALGVELEVPTLDGTERVRIDPGTRSGAVIRLPGRGVPNLQRRGRGDLFLRIEVAIPGPLSSKERALVERLAELRGERPGRHPLPGRLRRPE